MLSWSCTLAALLCLQVQSARLSTESAWCLVNLHYCFLLLNYCCCFYCFYCFDFNCIIVKAAVQTWCAWRDSRNCCGWTDHLRLHPCVQRLVSWRERIGPPTRIECTFDTLDAADMPRDEHWRLPTCDHTMPHTFLSSKPGGAPVARDGRGAGQ